MEGVVLLFGKFSTIFADNEDQGKVYNKGKTKVAKSTKMTIVS